MIVLRAKRLFSIILHQTEYSFWSKPEIKMSQRGDPLFFSYISQTARVPGVPRVRLETPMMKGIQGLNLDFAELNVCKNNNITTDSTETNENILLFIEELTSSLKSKSGYFTVTYSSPYEPKPNLCQNYKRISDAVDHFYVKGYDIESDGCTNPLTELTEGMNQFLDLGIHRSKIVQIVPWFNNQIETTENSEIKLKNRPIGICETHHLIQEGINQGSLPKGDDQEKCLSIDFQQKYKRKSFKIIYNTIETLKIKLYKIAVEFQLSGIGFWWANGSDNTDYDCVEKFLIGYWDLMKETVDVIDHYKVGEANGGSVDQIFDKL